MKNTYTTLDSGARVEFPSGMRRDTDAMKPRYDLIDASMLKRWAELMARGAAKYGERNWEKASSPEELQRFKASAFRHFMQWLNGEEDEDHASAILFNVAAAEHVNNKLTLKDAIETEDHCCDDVIDGGDDTLTITPVDDFREDGWVKEYMYK